MTSEIAQRTPEWFQARLGLVTASRVADVIARTAKGYGASRANYAADLVAERLTGTPATGYSSPQMQWGTDNEPDARAAYEFYRDVAVTETGFIRHPVLAAGASPDGLVGDDGLVEIKCPNTATHIETLTSQKIKAAYVTQMQWQMACTGREWCDFVSFDPRLPESMSLWVRRVPRDDLRIAELETEVGRFLCEVDETVVTLRRLYEPGYREAA